jgi:hypothetical protein
MDAAEELQRIHASGIVFTLQPDPRGFVVWLGDYRHDAEAASLQPTFDQAVGWLKEQVKFRYPDSDYAKRLLTN